MKKVLFWISYFVDYAILCLLFPNVFLFLKQGYTPSCEPGNACVQVVRNGITIDSSALIIFVIYTVCYIFLYILLNKKLGK